MAKYIVFFRLNYYFSMKAKKVNEHKKFGIMFMYTDVEFIYLFSNYLFVES
jgi:hypothetical protein